MIDRIFSAALTFALLIGGTLAIGSALLTSPAPRTVAKTASVRVVELERVVVVAKRLAAPTALAQADAATALR